MVVMGLLVDGHWQDQWYDTTSTGGRFVRKDSAFRNWVTPDGSPGPSGAGGFKAEPGRYHLYVSLACPWAHRTLIFRKLKGLADMIGVSVVHWLMWKTAGPSWTGRVSFRILSTAPAFSTRSIPGPSLATQAGSPCRCFGTRRPVPS